MSITLRIAVNGGEVVITGGKTGVKGALAILKTGSTIRGEDRVKGGNGTP